MPRGPKSEKRPADVIGNAVHVMRIATGEAEETAVHVPKRLRHYQTMRDIDLAAAKDHLLV
jgi:hypothetical protein